MGNTCELDQMVNVSTAKHKKIIANQETARGRHVSTSLANSRRYRRGGQSEFGTKSESESDIFDAESNEPRSSRDSNKKEPHVWCSKPRAAARDALAVGETVRFGHM